MQAGAAAVLRVPVLYSTVQYCLLSEPRGQGETIGTDHPGIERNVRGVAVRLE